MPRAVPMYTDFTAGELTPRLAGRVDKEKLHSGCRRMENMFAHTQGGATRRSGMRFVAEVKDSSKPVRLIPFIFSVEQAYILEFGHLYMRVYMNGGQVLDGGSPYEIATPYNSDDLAGIKYCQSADVIYLAHRNHAPRKLSRTGHTSWKLASVSFGADISPPTDVSVTGATGGHEHKYIITSLTEDMHESVPSASGMALGPATLSPGSHMAVNWTAADGAAEYYVYKSKNGIYGKIGRAAGTKFEDKGETLPDEADTPPTVQNPFSGADNYPACVCFYQQRLCWGGTNNNPVTLWMSKTGDFENLDRSNPARDDDSCEFSLNADQINIIRWMVPRRDLLIGTAGSEWKMSGSGGGPLTPSSVDAKRETLHGSADLNPVTMGNVVLFMDRNARRVREFVFSLDVDGYVAPDLSILAEHMTRSNSIVDWTYQQAPHSIVWCVRDDGVLLGMTYQREHQVYAWHRHVTAGQVEAAAVIPGDDRDELWLSVKRTINGFTRRFVELLEAEFNGDDTVNAFFVDSGLTYNGEPATAISGLDHLAGETVDVLADGAVRPTQKVSAGGTITLSRAASVVHVGLHYDSTLEPMFLEAGAADGTSQGRIKRISKVTVRLDKTLGLKMGPDENSLDRMEFRTTSDPMGRPPALFSGDKDMDWPGGYETRGGMVIRQDQPLPLTVLALVPRVNTSGS